MARTHLLIDTLIFIMQIGMVGLGKMGGYMSQRLTQDGHQVVGYNKDPVPQDRVKEMGITLAEDLKDLVSKLQAPRVVWVMVPHGAPTDETVTNLSNLLSKGDIIIDGGNTRYTDDLTHAEQLDPKGIHFMDAGVSGGVWGLEIGYCLMVGGEKEDFDHVEPVFKTLAPKDGYLHCRTGRLRPLRQDGAQRHRVRRNAILRGGL